MIDTLLELICVFWCACKETPRGMYAPFAAFVSAAVHNPVLESQVHARDARHRSK